MSSTNCLFCRIARKEIPSNTVYEDDSVIAFLDAYPLARGHVLVVPKVHVVLLEDLDEDKAEAVLMATYRLTSRVCAAVKAPASTIAINNGRESGQEIPHLHIHIVPRFNNDGGWPIHAIMKSKPHISRDEMAGIAKEIKGEGTYI